MRLSHAALALVGFVASSLAQSADDSSDTEPQNTTFNGVSVPPLVKLTPTNWEAETKKSKWLIVKHYSPYCPHCIDFAPTYQTMYEFYHTSKPADGTTFSQYYDWRFGLLNCVAYADLCEEHGVRVYPSTIIYEDGEQFDLVKGNQPMDQLSKAIEVALEKSRPGTRPKTLALPQAGDTEAPTAEKSKDAAAPAESSNPAEAGAASTKKPAEKEASGAGGDGKTPTRPTAPAKPTTTPNPGGISVALNAESFSTLVTTSQEPWFIKFYLPSCPHCKAMASTWEQLAKSMSGKLNIGEVDCSAQMALCQKDMKLNAFPSLIFFKGAEWAEYAGLRGLGDFQQYAEKALELAGGVPEVDAESFKALEKEEVIFVYFYDHATTSEDFAALERLPLSLIGRAKLVKTRDPKLNDRFKITTWPRLMVSREGRPTYYPPLTPNEMRDVRGVTNWMRSVWLPLVPELTPSSARQIMEGKVVVLGLLNRGDRDGFQSSLREMKSAANEWMDRQTQEFQLERKKLRDSKQMRIEEAADRNDARALRAAKAIRINMGTSGRKEVAFAWVDGIYWQRWIRTTFGIDVKEGERVVIHDQDNRRYWDTTATGNHVLVSRTSIMETLDKIIYTPNVIKHKLTVSAAEKVLLDVRAAFLEHPFLTLGCVAGLGFAVFSWHRGRSRRRGGASSGFRIDDTMGIKELKEGLLGANGNQKAD